MRRVLLFVFLVACLFPVVGAGTQEGDPIPPESSAVEPSNNSHETSMEATITLGDVSDEPIKKIKRMNPLSNYLVDALGEYGITSGKVTIAPDMETMSEFLRTGEVDIYFDSLYPAMIVSDASGARPVLRRWKDGVGEYYSVFFAHIDTGVVDISGLRGKIIAFEEPNSTSGYMLPLAYLKEVGEKPVRVGSLNAKVGSDEIGYVFAGEDQNVINWVLRGNVVAGVVDNTEYEKLDAEPSSLLTMLAQTESVARQVAVVSGTMPPEQRDAVVEILKRLHESDEGREVLKALKKTDRFDEFPEGVDTAMERMRRLYLLTQSGE